VELCAGMTLRDRGLYALAARCFEQSGDAAARFDALARDARVLAVRASGEERRRLSLQAAGLFLQSLESLGSRWTAGSAVHAQEAGADAHGHAADAGSAGAGVLGSARQEIEAFSAPPAIASMSSCGRCLYDGGKYQEAGDVFVAAVRMLSARSAYVAPDAIGQQYGQVRAEKSASGESVDALDTRLARDAVRCYRKAGLLDCAVDVLVEMRKLETALRLLKDEHKYDKALQVLDAHPSFVPPPDLSAHEFLRQAAAALGLACSNARGSGGGGGGGTGGGRRSRATQAEEAAKRAKREEAETAFMKALERMPELEGQRLLRRYGFHAVLERKLLQGKEYAKAAQIMYEDARGAAAVGLLLSLPAPTSAELLLAAHLSAQLAFSLGGRGGSDGSASDTGELASVCVDYLTKAASALDRLQQQDQRQCAAGAGAAAGAGGSASKHSAAGLFSLLLKFEAAVRAREHAAVLTALAEVEALARELDCTLAVALALQAQAVVGLHALTSASASDARGEYPADAEGRREVGEDVMAGVREALKALWHCLRCVLGQSGHDEAQMRRFEAFLGLSSAVERGGGALSISKFRLPLLLSVLSHGETHRQPDATADLAGTEAQSMRVPTAAYGKGGAYGGTVPVLPAAVTPAAESAQEVLLDPGRVRGAVAAMLLDAILGLLSTLHTTLGALEQRELESAATCARQQRACLRMCALQAWALDKGIAAAQQYERTRSPHIPADALQAARVRRHKTVFSKPCRRKACAQLVRAMVSFASHALAAAYDEVGAGGDGRKRKLALHDAFWEGSSAAGEGAAGAEGGGSVWAVLREECVDVMRRFATEELRRWAKLDVADKSGLALSRILLLLSRLGLDDYHDHILLSIPRIGGQHDPHTSSGPADAPIVTGWHVPMALPPRGWHPPRVLGYNAFAALHRSMTCARNGLRLGKAAHLLTHLHLHVRWEVGDDAWLSLQEAVTETCVALSWFGAPGEQESGVRAHTMVLWLPWSLAAPLVGQQRTRPAQSEPDAAPVLRSALQLIPRLLRRCFELQAAASSGEAEDEAEEGGWAVRGGAEQFQEWQHMAEAMVWTVLLNIGVHCCQRLSQVGAQARWDARWAPAVQDVLQRLARAPSLLSNTNSPDAGKRLMDACGTKWWDVGAVSAMLAARGDGLVAVAAMEGDVVEVGAVEVAELEADMRLGLQLDASSFHEDEQDLDDYKTMLALCGGEDSDLPSVAGPTAGGTGGSGGGVGGSSSSNGGAGGQSKDRWSSFGGGIALPRAPLPPTDALWVQRRAAAAIVSDFARLCVLICIDSCTHTRTPTTMDMSVYAYTRHKLRAIVRTSALPDLLANQDTCTRTDKSEAWQVRFMKMSHTRLALGQFSSP